MKEELLQKFAATADKYGYDWDVVFNKFPELNGYDKGVLKQYAATANKYGYDWDVVNPKFPELGFSNNTSDVKKKSIYTTFYTKFKQWFNKNDKQSTTKHFGIVFGRYFFGFIRYK